MEGISNRLIVVALIVNSISMGLQSLRQFTLENSYLGMTFLGLSLFFIMLSFFLVFKINQQDTHKDNVEEQGKEE